MEFEIRVQPKAKCNNVENEGGKLKVRVTAAPEDGKASAAVIELLAKRLGIAKNSISILRGFRSKDKLLRIEGLSRGEVFRRLSSA